jgi:hypothetical protein
MEGQTDFSMVQEACDLYSVQTLPDGRTEIRIVVPRRFSDLWLAKLSELRANGDDLEAE